MSIGVVSDEPLRAAMVERLREMGAIRRDEVAAAFLRVPRHLFAPEATSLEQAYDVEAVIQTKWAEDGTAISSVSAPQIQARMVEQAGITRGMRVLELGSVLWSVQLLQGRLTDRLAKIAIRDGLATTARNRALDNASIRCREGLVPLR